MTHSLRGVFLALSIASTLCAQGPMTVRWHDLGGAQWRMTERVTAPRALPLHEAFLIRESRDPEDLKELGEPMTGADEGFSALRILLGEDLMADVELIHLASGAMLVRAPESTHERLRQGIQTLRDAFSRRARVRVFQAKLASAAGQDTLILSAEAVKAWIEKAGAELVAMGQLPIGGGSTLKAQETLEVAGDIIVEIANTAAIGQLERRTLTLGFDLSLNLHDEHGGGLFVSYAMSNSRLLDQGTRVKTGEAMLITEQGMVTRELPSIELVRTEGLLARGSASVPSGGGLLVVNSQGGSPTATLICFEPEALSAALTQGTSRLWPLARLAARPFSNPVHLPMLAADREETSLECGEDASAPLESDEAEELLSQLASEDDDAETLLLGDFAFVWASADAHSRIEKMLKAAEAALSRTIAFEFRYGALERSALDQPLADLAKSLSGRACLTARENDPFAFIAGKERTRIGTHQVEIAQQAACPAPGVMVHFAGIILAGRFDASDETTLHGTLHCSLREEQGQKTFPLTQESALELDLSTNADFLTHGKARWALGAWNLVRMHHGNDNKSHVVLVRPMLAQ